MKNEEKRQEAKDPLYHPEVQAQRGGRRVRGRPSGGRSMSRRGRGSSTRIAVELTREVVTPPRDHKKEEEEADPEEGKAEEGGGGSHE